MILDRAADRTPLRRSLPSLTFAVAAGGAAATTTAATDDGIELRSAWPGRSRALRLPARVGITSAERARFRRQSLTVLLADAPSPRLAGGARARPVRLRRRQAQDHDALPEDPLGLRMDGEPDLPREQGYSRQTLRMIVTPRPTSPGAACGSGCPTGRVGTASRSTPSRSACGAAGCAGSRLAARREVPRPRSVTLPPREECVTSDPVDAPCRAVSRARRERSGSRGRPVPPPSSATRCRPRTSRRGAPPTRHATRRAGRSRNPRSRGRSSPAWTSSLPERRRRWSRSGTRSRWATRPGRTAAIDLGETYPDLFARRALAERTSAAALRRQRRDRRQQILRARHSPSVLQRLDTDVLGSRPSGA